MKIRCGAYFDVIKKKKVNEADLIIENGKIADISPVKGSLNAKDLDLSREMLLPGFIDAHNHLCFDVGDEVKQTNEALGYQALVGAKNARLAVNSGVTTLRDAGEKDYVDFSVKRAIIEGLIAGPRLVVAGPGLMRTGGHMWFMGREADGESEIRKEVRKQLRAGVDYVKIFVSGGATSHYTDVLTPEMTQREIEVAVEEAHMAGRSIGAHTHGGLAATWAIEAGIDAIEHGCFLNDEQISKMRERGTFLVSTSGIQRAIRDCTDNPIFMRQKAEKSFSIYQKTIGTAIRQGVCIAIGNDTNHGCIAEEIEFLIKAGSCVEDALASATITGAVLCGLDDITGSIDIGKEADIVAVRADPMKQIETVQNPSWVIKSGQILKSPRGIV